MSAATDYRFAGADGLQLYSRIYAGPAPEAPTLLCLHGLMHNGADFEELAPQLAAQHRVIVPDVRGRGRSARDARPANYQVPTYVADVMALLKGLAVSRVAIIGTSMGGLIGMVLAATQPALVSRLVLNDIGPQIDAAGLERIRAYAGRTTGRRPPRSCAAPSAPPGRDLARRAGNSWRGAATALMRRGFCTRTQIRPSVRYCARLRARLRTCGRCGRGWRTYRYSSSAARRPTS